MAINALVPNTMTKVGLSRAWKQLWRRGAKARKLYGSTILTESTILFGQLIAYKLAASYLGKDGFSEYALARRTINLLQPASILGLNIAIPRYVAYSAGRRPADSPENYFAPALLIIGSALVVCLVLLNLMKKSAAFLFLGSPQHDDLIPAVGLFLVGLTLHMACEGYFRGRFAMTRANALRLINLGLMPVIIFPVFRDSAEGVLTAIGASMGVASAVALLFTRFGAGVTRLLARAGELVIYGLGRVPADLLQLAFISLPAILIAHLQGIGTAGFVAFGTSVMIMLCSLFPPVSSVLLPEASHMISRGDTDSLKRRVGQVLVAALATTLFSVLAIEFFARPLFRLYLGSTFSDAVGIVRIIIVGALPYAIYLSLRSVIDAFSMTPINSKNMLISFAVFLAGTAAVYLKPLPPAYILAAFVGALYVLGGLTLLEVRNICRYPGAGCDSANQKSARLENPLPGLATSMGQDAANRSNL
jgi:O-antigen/teichoic acid export membrane protein